MLFFGGCNYSNRKRTPIKALPFYSEHFRFYVLVNFPVILEMLGFSEKKKRWENLSQRLGRFSWIFHHLRSANRIIRLQLCVRLSRLPKGQVLDMWPSKWRQGPSRHSWFFRKGGSSRGHFFRKDIQPGESLAMPCFFVATLFRSLATCL